MKSERGGLKIRVKLPNGLPNECKTNKNTYRISEFITNEIRFKMNLQLIHQIQMNPEIT